MILELKQVQIPFLSRAFFVSFWINVHEYIYYKPDTRLYDQNRLFPRSVQF